jgi:hypothetical protein
MQFVPNIGHPDPKWRRTAADLEYQFLMQQLLLLLPLMLLLVPPASVAADFRQMQLQRRDAR